MKIGGVYILTRRSILRILATITAALMSVSSAATIRRIHDTAISLHSLDRQFVGRQVRTVVPDIMYLEYKALYLELKSSDEVPPLVAPAHRTRPVHAAAVHSHARTSAAEGFTTADRKMLEKIYRASVYGEMPTAAQVVGDVRRRQIAYGVSLYKPSSRSQKGVSYRQAAKNAINAPQFQGIDGTYSMDEVKSLARAIQRAYGNG